jgi:hypothetical protein
VDRCMTSVLGRGLWKLNYRSNRVSLVPRAALRLRLHSSSRFNCVHSSKGRRARSAIDNRSMRSDAVYSWPCCMSSCSEAKLLEPRHRTWATTHEAGNDMRPFNLAVDPAIVAAGVNVLLLENGMLAESCSQRA